MIPTLPLALRNRLAGLILAALREPAAREELRRLAPGEGDALAGWLAPDEGAWAAPLAERALAASRALEARPLRADGVPLATALEDAGMLWDARLYFEVHELLEPAWSGAEGETREALQGLIQAAVGYQHLANGNLRGARALLEEGSARLHGRRLGALELDAFARALAASAARLDDFDWSVVPRFPRAGED